ncbi:hypothetical protein OH76DRAFT_1413474 [Lentinus brumalis]|uniref:REJ domain-containing protein n=1 Tax=Lentinus brumalis TaxID=2498619 RepID=A0A371CH29_9APHY|nr:hypothetical protein OH76DRAFT_1413474 [Polyporus brumalis]
MDAFCSGSACGLAKRRRLYPRQTPSIGAVATSFPGAGTSAAAGASSGATTSAPSAPTGRQDPSDAVSGDPPTQSGDSANSGASGDSSQPPESKPSSDPPSSGPSSQPTSKPSSDPPSSDPTTAPPSSKPTSQPPSSDPSSAPTTAPPSSEPTSLPPSSDPSSNPTSDPSSSPLSSPSSLPSSESSSATPTFSPTSLPSALVADSSITSPSPSSSGSFQTTITSAIATTVINGTTSTIFTAIPTTLSQSDSDSSSSATKRDMIAGSVGGAAFLILVTALFLFYRRHQHKKLSFFKRLQPKPRTRLLDGEDMDDYDMGPQTRYRDYPASVASSHTQTNATSSAVPGRSPLSRDFHDTSPVMSIVGPPMDPHREGTPSSLPPGAAAPHLLGMRAETGSIFREAVWPPPGQPSALVDPLVKASSAVDLSRIVDDVMRCRRRRRSAIRAARPRDVRMLAGGRSGQARIPLQSRIADLREIRG